MSWDIRIEGVDELFRAFEKLPEKAQKVAAEALYEGAGVVADKVSGAVHGIATAPFKFAKGGDKRLPSPEEKAILTGAKHGISKFRKDGLSVQTSVGFSNAGYGEITWNHARSGGSRTIYKQGKGGRMVHASQGTGSSMKPVPLIANSINSGTTFMKKQPFLRKAFSQSKSAATAAIEAGIKARESELEIG